jgi:hypothetical protein
MPVNVAGNKWLHIWTGAVGRPRSIGLRSRGEIPQDYLLADLSPLPRGETKRGLRAYVRQ